MKQKLSGLLVIGILLMVGSPALAGGARPGKEWKSWFGHFGGGWTMPTGDFGDVADDTFYLDAGATYWPDAWPIGIVMDLSWNENDIKNSAIDLINEQLNNDPRNSPVTGGDVETWSLNVNAQWGPDTGGAVGFYLTGGVGIDWTSAKVTSPGLIYYPPVCGGWYYWCYPGGVGSGDLIRADENQTNFGYNGGIGVTFELGSGSQLYLEAKYKVTEADQQKIEQIPLIVGFRW